MSKYEERTVHRLGHRLLFGILVSVLLVPPSGGQGDAAAPKRPGTEDLYANFPVPIPLVISGEVLTFRSTVESLIAAARPSLHRPEGLIGLSDTLVKAWTALGDRLDSDHGDFPNMARDHAYWLLLTDDAADTLADRFGFVLEGFVRAHPEEMLGIARADWELAAEKLGVPRTRIFGFQIAELMRRGLILLDDLKKSHPNATAVLEDAYIRFLWDNMQFYRQLHATWYDKHTMRVAQEDWIVHRLKGRCPDPKWQPLISLSAVSVDTSRYDPMADKFMHRIAVVDPDCPDTADFIILMPHFRLMEEELSRKSDLEKEGILEQIKERAARRAKPSGGSKTPGR